MTNGEQGKWHLDSINDAWNAAATMCGLAGNGGISVHNRTPILVSDDLTNICVNCLNALQQQVTQQAGLLEEGSKSMAALVGEIGRLRQQVTALAATIDWDSTLLGSDVATIVDLQQQVAELQRRNNQLVQDGQQWITIGNENDQLRQQVVDLTAERDSYKYVDYDVDKAKVYLEQTAKHTQQLADSQAEVARLRELAELAKALRATLAMLRAPLNGKMPSQDYVAIELARMLNSFEESFDAALREAGVEEKA